MNSARRRTMVAWIAALTTIDLATKIWATATLDDKPITLPGPIDLQLSYNNGTAFGLFTNIPPLLITAATLTIALALLTAAWNGRTPTGPAALIIAGALANTIDRLEAGSVVDMLHTGWWPTFNVADIFITTGVAWWAITATNTDHSTSPTIEPSSTTHQHQT